MTWLTLLVPILAIPLNVVFLLATIALLMSRRREDL